MTVPQIRCRDHAVGLLVEPGRRNLGCLGFIRLLLITDGL